MSRQMTCDEAVRRIALGERGAEPGVEAHLISCASCRSEAEALHTIIRSLQVQPAAEVPPRLDRSILRAMAARQQNALPAWIALALSATATFALVTGIVITLANASRAEVAMLQGLVIGIAYIAISSVATLPLFARMARSHRRAGQWT